MNNIKKFGLWFSIASAIFRILWFIAFIFAGIVFTRNTSSIV
jgi:hypothetical protein